MERKGIGKSILGLFVNVEGDPAQTTPAKPVSASRSAPAGEVLPKGEAAKGFAAPLPLGAIDAEIAKSLAGALEENNIPGFDYFEFAKTVEALRPTIPTEQTLYQASFASGSVLGATRAVLVSSADHYLHVLGKKREEFESVVASQYETAVGGKEQSLQKIEAQIKEKTELIRTLSDEITALNRQKHDIASQIVENKTKIDSVKSNFMTTFETFTRKITDDVQKIGTYIS